MRIVTTIVWILAILSLSTSQTLAQLPSFAPFPPLSTNPGFEDANGSGTLTGWNYSDSRMVPTIVDVPPPAAPPDPNIRPTASFVRNYQSTLGRKMIRLDGAGGFGQYFFIGSKTTHLMMSGMAYARRVSGSGEPSVIAQVTCYDVWWNELQRTHTNIGPKRTEPSNTSGLLPFSNAVLVPKNTCIVLMAIWNWDPGVQVFADAFGAVDMSLPQWNGTTYPSPELLVNPRVVRRVSPLTPFTPLELRLGTEFWCADYDPAHVETVVDSLPRDYGILTWGSPTMQESAYQMVNVKGDTLYSIYYREDSISINYATRDALVGLDHYDVNWKYLGQSNYIGQDNLLLSNVRVIRPPTGTAYSSFFFYVPSNGGFSRPSFSLQALGKYVNGQLCTVKPEWDFVRHAGYVPVAKVILADDDGVDVSTLSANDFYATSKSTPGKTYPGVVLTLFNQSEPQNVPNVLDKGRIVTFGVGFTATDAELADFGAVVIKPKAIFDKKGNAFPSKSVTYPPRPAT